MLAGAAASAAVAAPASARPGTTTIVRDGRYGAGPGLDGRYTFFTVRDRRVYDLHFNLPMICTTAEGNFQRFFDGGRAPAGRRIPAGGRLRLEWTVFSNGRLGLVHATIDFARTPDIARFDVIAPDPRRDEDCDGAAAMEFARQSRRPPGV